MLATHLTPGTATWPARVPETPCRAAAPKMRYALAAALYMAFMAGLSSVPRGGESPGGVAIELGLNLIHVPLFGGLMCLLVMAFAAARRPSRARRPCGLALVCVVLFAALDEWQQAYVPGRSASPIDFLLDVVGALTMLLLLEARALLSEEP